MKGRAGRQEWWFIFLAVVIAVPRVLGWTNAVVLTGGSGVSPVSPSSLALLTICHLTVVALALNLQRTVTVRRAHDFDGRVWPFWIYAVVVIAIRGLDLMSLATDIRVPAAWLAYAYYGAIVLSAAVFGFRRGHPGANRWGTPPRPFFDFAAPRSNNYKPPQG